MNKAMVGAFVASVFSASALAGTYIESSMSDQLAPQNPAMTSKMWLDKGRFRVEMQNGQQVQLFSQQTMYVLNVPAKSYSKIDKASLAAISKQAKDASNAMLDLLPPAQREEQLKKRAQNKPKIDRQLKPTSRTESTAGHSCKVWEVFVNGAKAQEVCVLALASVPNSQDLVSTMQQMTEMMEGFGSNPAQESWSDVQKMGGIPIITRVYFNGKPRHEVKITAIRATPTQDSQFVLPAGFKEQKLGG